MQLMMTLRAIHHHQPHSLHPHNHFNNIVEEGLRRTSSSSSKISFPNALNVRERHASQH
jgi:hypothetical protein